MEGKMFSVEMKSMMRTPGVKKIWLCEYDLGGVHSCQNCGGVGYMYLFIAKAGPFDNTPTVGVSSWFDNKWWVGEHFAFACPVCSNSKPIHIQLPVEPEIQQIDFTNV